MRRIAHISDLHFGRHHPKVVDALLESISSEQPDVVVVSGDLTQRAKRDEFLAARRFLQRIGRPLLILPGNHDMPLYNLYRRLQEPFRRYNRDIAPLGLPDCFYADGEIAILGLNTARRLKWKEGRLSLKQMSRIATVFAPMPPPVLKILVTHHPVAATQSSAASIIARASLAARALAAAKVHVVLSGHHHHALSGEGLIDTGLNHSVLAIHAGTAVSTRLRGEQPNSYNIIDVNFPRLSVSILSARGDFQFRSSGRASYALTENRWVPDRTSFAVAS